MKALFGLLILFLVGAQVVAGDIPGGISRTAEGLPRDTYELLIAPSYTFNPTGAYLSSEIRYQPNEDFGAGFGFGAGEVGFNFGLHGTWFILPDLAEQPAVSLLGGLYFNRLEEANFFNVRIAPMVSKGFRMDWGKLTPYAALNMTPSFRLSQPDNQFSVKAALGTQVEIQQFNGLRLFTEVDVGVVKSVSEFSFGLSYPFAAL